MRSDTVTTPTAAMREAMKAAVVGDDVFGDDPTVNALQERVARLFGKEAALFVPSGTAGNLICVMAHCWDRGAEYVVGDRSHIVVYEQGGAAQFGGAHPRCVATRADGTFDEDDVRDAFRGDDPHYPRTRLVCLENTHNLCGGVALPAAYAWRMRGIVDDRGGGACGLHVDGARIWHAAEASGESLRDLAAPADSLSVCVSKGLGAPCGSLVVGSRDLVARATRLRKALGGGMRQAGVLAAAADVALDDVLPNLGRDRERAAALGRGLGAIPGVAVDDVHTNLVFADVSATGAGPDHFEAALEARGVRALAFDDRRVRFVLHHQVPKGGVDRALSAVRDIAAAV